MLARWRTVAAVTGVLWLSCGSTPCNAHGQAVTPHRIACTPNDDSLQAADCSNHEPGCWYDEYYRNYWQPTSSTESTSQMFQAGEPHETQRILDLHSRSSYPSCPCHDSIDLDFNKQPSSPEDTCMSPDGNWSSPDDEFANFDAEFDGGSLWPDQLPDSSCSSRVLTLTIDSAAPADLGYDEAATDGPRAVLLIPDLNRVDRQTSTSKALLAGSILPATADEDFEPEPLDLSIEDDDFESTSEPQIPDAIEPAEEPPVESPHGTPRYHMFYPGCDWSPYYPAQSADEAETQPLEVLSPDYATAPRRPSLPFSFPGAAWINHSAFTMVTWTGKLAERVYALIGPASIPERAPAVESAARLDGSLEGLTAPQDCTLGSACAPLIR